MYTTLPSRLKAVIVVFNSTIFFPTFLVAPKNSHINTQVGVSVFSLRLHASCDKTDAEDVRRQTNGHHNSNTTPAGSTIRSIQ